MLSYAYDVFKEIDDDMSGHVDFSEFRDWIRESIELQDFLLLYTGVQTFESAKRRYTEQLEIFKDIFDSQSAEFMGGQYAPVVKLNKILTGAFWFIDK